MRIVAGKPLRILDFDIENRPLSYWRKDRPTAEVTAIAWGWTDAPDNIECWMIGKDDPVRMLRTFSEVYASADMIVGHYIRAHDLRIVNAALVENGLPILGPKLTQDTCLDLVKWSDLPKSQENLIEIMGIPGGKKHMTQADWREANRLTPIGLAKTKDRVVSDVSQNMKLREVLLERNLLTAPKVWHA